MKVLFLDTVHPYLGEALESAGFLCVLDNSSPKEKIEEVAGEYHGIVIRSRFRIDKNFIDKAINLKFIARAGAGMENIDVLYAESRGIKCFHAPEGNRDAVAEHALGMLLALFNNLCKTDAEVRKGTWLREENRGVELMGKTVAIIGYGNMGSAFARRLKSFSVKVIAYDKYKKNYSDEFAEEADMYRIYNEADVVSLHLPLTEETKYLVNDEFIGRFKKPIYIINTSRGKILNTNDLTENIKKKKVLGACLDVLEYEAVSFEQLKTEELPDAFKYLVKNNKVILSPHIAGWTHESNYKIAKTLAEKILTLK